MEKVRKALQGEGTGSGNAGRPSWKGWWLQADREHGDRPSCGTPPPSGQTDRRAGRGLSGETEVQADGKGQAQDKLQTLSPGDTGVRGRGE